MELEMVRKENCRCSLFRAHSKQVKVLTFGFHSVQYLYFTLHGAEET